MKTFITISLLVSWSIIVSQVQNLPLNFKFNQVVEKNAIENNEVISIKPFNRQFLKKGTYTAVYADSNKYYYDVELKLFKESLLNIKEKDVILSADPLFSFVYGRTFVNDTSLRLLDNTRGVRVAGDITSKFSFETRYYETQVFYPTFLDSVASVRNVAFGKGRAKSFNVNGWDVGTAMGYVSFKAASWLNIQFGNTNQFIGNGYRSLLLADNSLNYPNLTFQASFLEGKLRYMNTNAWLQTTERIPYSSTPESQFKSKDASFRYLVYHPVNQFEIGFFEGTIYNTYNDSLGEHSPNFAFYIPIVGASTIVNGMNSKNKVLLGVNANYRLKDRFLLFGQYAFDSNGDAYQLGFKWYDFMHIRNAWLHIEYDHVDPFVYSMSSSNYLQTYSNSDQELAYSLGASVDEVLAKVYLPYERFYGMASFHFASKERFNGSVEGEDIFQPNDNVIIAKEKVDWNYSMIELGYNMNIQTRMNFFLNFGLRNEAGKDWRTNESFWQVGIRTQLNNYYLER